MASVQTEVLAAAMAPQDALPCALGTLYSSTDVESESAQCTAGQSYGTNGSNASFVWWQLCLSAVSSAGTCHDIGTYDINTEGMVGSPMSLQKREECVHHHDNHAWLSKSSDIKILGRHHHMCDSDGWSVHNNWDKLAHAIKDPMPRPTLWAMSQTYEWVYCF